MLDTDTKRRIDTARDILVGKLPDPKSQVEQITIALIYKFMDDMDATAEELGGDRTFFAGDFQRYGWARLMRGGLGGHEMLGLYSEAITRMPENPGIPVLFRDIFKNAFLPYRDPETLRAFLKVIDAFEYDHSERLGDAFEYLLSVLGSQGDAGQFRTPRHIIDFIVSIVDPKKDETILDPACGTAGFLISSYKHMHGANTDETGNSTLTPDERERLAANFRGYDISPDMVRLSLVNMYLHGFADPQIHEYDTLTSQDRWNEHADIILANPPFMSPKGGIKPHNRFSVQSKRSEVLFVDYIAEHLTQNGRAGIIVPEGIIFQSQAAYRQLRKLLVEDSLVAVVSLPAGVFNPYSGVKTSILILDKSLAKKSATVGFFKIANDGFGLGAQRRATLKNDLPEARVEIAEYLHCLRAGASLEGFAPAYGRVVPKEKLAEGGDFNLSGERYGETEAGSHAFPLVRIADVCTVNPRKSQLRDYEEGTRVSFVPMADLNEHRIAFHPISDKRLGEVSASYTYFEDGDVLLAKVTPCFENGKAGIARGLLNGIGFGSSEFYVLRANNQVLPEWLYFCVMHQNFRDAAVARMTGTGGLQRVPRDYVESFQIPLPPLEVQKEIVAEIGGYQRIIDGARTVLDNYRPHIPAHPDWPDVRLEALVELARGVTYTKSDEVTEDGQKILRANNIDNTCHCLDLSDIKQISKSVSIPDDKRLRRGDVFICLASGSKDHIGKAAYIADETDYYIGGFMGAVRVTSPDLDPRYLFHHLTAKRFNEFLRQEISGASINNLGGKLLRRFTIPLAPLATQRAVVAEVEAEQALVSGNRELIARLESKIQASVARAWDPLTAETPLNSGRVA